MAGCDSSEVNFHEELIRDEVEVEEQEKIVLGHRHGHGDHDHKNGHGRKNGHGHKNGHDHDHDHKNGHGHGHGSDDDLEDDLCGGFDPVKRIIKGFNNFLNHDYRRNPDRFEQLALTQNPKFLVFSCSDSRVSPSRIIDFKVGEAFGARNISALIPTSDKVGYSDVGATIEYAVEELKVENILVIGHSSCGGITRLMKHPEDNSVPFEFIDEWVSIALPAKLKVKAEYGHLPFDEQRDLCVQEAVNVSLVNLLSYPYVQKAVDEGKLALRGAYYDFVVGSLKLWEFKSSLMTPPIIID